MADQSKTPAEQAAFDEAARRWHEAADQFAHEKKMELFRAGKLGLAETEQIIADEIARGDRERQQRYLEELRKERELGARLRGHGV